MEGPWLQKPGLYTVYPWKVVETASSGSMWNAAMSS